MGANLHDHLQIRMMWKVQGPTLNERTQTWAGKAKMALEYFLFKTGPLTMPPSQLGAFARSDPSQLWPDIEWHVQPLSLEKFGDRLHPFPAITPSVCNLRPTSRGWVRIKSSDPFDAPEIRLNYLTTPADQAVAARSMRFTRKIMEAPAMAKYKPSEWRPGPRRSRTRSWCTRRGTWVRRSSTPWARARWDATRRPWWTTACVCTESRGSALSMHRSCRASPPATPMHPRT